MISAAGTAMLALEKDKCEELPPRLKELRKKIRDPEYIEGAVQRIAQVISKKIIESPEDDLIFGDGEIKSEIKQ